MAKDAAPLYKKAKKLYDGVAAQLVTQGHTLDVFAVALEQVGLAEMKEAVERTGGLTIQTDTYGNPVFSESLPRVFLLDPAADGYLGLVSTATLEVIPSRDIKVCGLLGPAAAMEKKSVAVSETVIGVGGTTLFKLPSMDKDTTLLTLYDVVGSTKDKAANGSLWQQFFVQFVTKFTTAEGEQRCRVTTVTRRCGDVGVHALRTASIMTLNNWENETGFHNHICAQTDVASVSLIRHTNRLKHHSQTPLSTMLCATGLWTAAAQPT